MSVSSCELCPDPALTPTNQNKHSADGRTPLPVTPQPSTPVSIPTDEPALRPGGISHQNPSFRPFSSPCQHPVPGSGHPSAPALCRGLGGSLPTSPPAGTLARLCTVARGLGGSLPTSLPACTLARLCTVARGLGGSLPTSPPACTLAHLCTVARGLQEGEPEHASTPLTEPPSVSRWPPAVWSSPASISPGCLWSPPSCHPFSTGNRLE